MKCRICEQVINNIVLVSKVPKHVSVLKKEARRNLITEDLNFFQCSNCGHGQIEYVNNKDYYDEYLMQVSYSEKMNLLQDKELIALNYYAYNNDKFLEVGSGDGNFLLKSKSFFKNEYGYEPSKSFFNLCLEKNLNVVNEYFPSEDIKNIKFDAFASRQVFEHLPNPREVLLSIYEQINDNGVGLIEIPNGKKIIREGRYFEIISDHVNYFTPRSLLTLVENCGFDVIELKEEFEGDYLVVYIRKNKKMLNIMQAKRNDYKLINELFKNNQDIIVWGAGAKAFNFMTLLEDDSNVVKYVDGDKYKHGLFLPNASKKIEFIDDSIVDSKLVVIFASSYENEIINLLKEKGFTGKIFSFISKKITDIKDL